MSIPIVKPRHKDYWKSPAEARCSCGSIVVLSDPLDNTCRCGRVYNTCGQEVIHSSLCDKQGNPYEEP